MLNARAIGAYMMKMNIFIQMTRKIFIIIVIGMFSLLIYKKTHEASDFAMFDLEMNRMTLHLTVRVRIRVAFLHFRKRTNDNVGLQYANGRLF